MEYTKQTNIKNRKLYIHGSRVILDELDSNNLKVDTRSFEDIFVYYIWYLSPNNQFNLLYIVIPDVYGYIKKDNGNRYLEITSTDNNKDLLKKYTDIWNKIKPHMSSGCHKYVDDCMKIKIESDDDLPLNKLLNFNLLTIFVKFIYELYGHCYPQIFVDSCCMNKLYG